jgi:cytochrome c-type biogenesis protein CcmH
MTELVLTCQKSTAATAAPWWRHVLWLLCWLPVVVTAAEALPLAADPAQEARMLSIAAELRCLVCQNQTIADSHSGLATDLRQEIREQLARGQTDQEVRDFMTARYGDFILYRPPVKSSTALLWFGPGLLAVSGVGLLWLVLRRRSRLSDDAFEPEQAEADEQKL